MDFKSGVIPQENIWCRDFARPLGGDVLMAIDKQSQRGSNNKTSWATTRVPVSFRT